MATRVESKVESPGSIEAFDIVGNLPSELAIKVLKNLSPKDLTRCARVCKKWQALADSNYVWKQFVPKVLQNKEITDYKNYVRNNTILEDNGIENIIEFMKSIQFNECGELIFRFLQDKNAKMTILFSKTLKKYETESKDGDYSKWLESYFDKYTLESNRPHSTYNKKTFFKFLKSNKNANIGNNKIKSPVHYNIIACNHKIFVCYGNYLGDIPLAKSEIELLKSSIKKINEDIHSQDMKILSPKIFF